MQLKTLPLTFAICVTIALAADAGDVTQHPLKLRLDSVSGLEANGGILGAVVYRGRRAVQLKPLTGHENDDGSLLATITNSDFKDGTIELDVAGAPRPGSAPNMKGFIGLAFRVRDNGQTAELVYLRPANGRADDQLTRNHSIQYVSDPGYTWQRLRKEFPGGYESYVDLEAGVWTHMKIVVSGMKARVYINGGSQPSLVVNDLKQGDAPGRIALWTHPTTEAYFSNLTVR
jgi:hypothetical protein